jgi:2-oxoglutarate ferredoxin oxidoreductase subunit gamma
VISASEIDFPKVLIPNVTVCLSQEACDRYAGQEVKGGLLIIDSDRVRRAPTVRAVSLPLATLARESAGREVSANVVALGVLAGLTGLVSRESLEGAVQEWAPTGTAQVNLRALSTGYDAANRFLQEHR